MSADMVTFVLLAYFVLLGVSNRIVNCYGNIDLWNHAFVYQLPCSRLAAYNEPGPGNSPSAGLWLLTAE